MTEMKEMHESAPGEDRVRTGYIRNAGTEAKAGVVEIKDVRLKRGQMRKECENGYYDSAIQEVYQE